MQALLSASTLMLVLVAAMPGETTCDKPFEAKLRSGAVLTLDLRAGDIDIAGVESETIRVSCSADDSRDLQDIRVAFENSGPSAKLRIKGGPNKSVRLRIEVPTKTHLVLNGTAGDVDIRGIRGDKNVSLRAGDLKVSVGDPADYAEIEASVNAGDLDMAAFGEHKGGLFRRYHKKQSTGTYALRARLWAGNISFR
jgi:hypothetical protein